MVCGVGVGRRLPVAVGHFVEEVGERHSCVDSCEKMLCLNPDGVPYSELLNVSTLAAHLIDKVSIMPPCSRKNRQTDQLDGGCCSLSVWQSQLEEMCQLQSSHRDPKYLSSDIHATSQLEVGQFKFSSLHRVAEGECEGSTRGLLLLIREFTS